MSREYEGFEDIVASIVQADFEINEAGLQQHIKIVIFGGSAFIYRDEKNFRPTRDIDAVIIFDEELDEEHRKVKQILSNNNISSNIEAILDFPPPEDYVERWEEIDLELQWIKVYVASTIDLIMSKVFTSRPKDYYDLVNSNLIEKVNYDYLIEVYEEYKTYSHDPRSENHDLYAIIAERKQKERGV